MRLRKGAILLFVCLGYGMVSMYTAYIANSDPKKSNAKDLPDISDFISDQKIPHNPGLSHSSKQPEHQNVVIWDTCGLGVYLWRNILHGKITRYNLFNGWTHDNLEIGGLSLQLSNCGQTLEALPESCDNEWILPYLHQSRIKCLFLVYDSPLVDDDLVYQWPLGVALHRNFRNYGDEFLDLTAPRKYVFNFVGTVYESGSRVDMMEAIKTMEGDAKYFVRTRSNWTDEESSDDVAVYQRSLLESDITLSPVGRNSECSRIYEALEMGSIPIIEDVLTEGTCGNFEGEDPANLSFTPPHRLLKRYKAPVVFVRNWRRELPRTVRKFSEMSHRKKFRLRLDLIRWYVDFKTGMKNRFLSVIQDKFGMN